MARNYDMATECSLCNLPFKTEEEGLEKELAGVPVRLCGKCWSGMIDTVEELASHMTITCPHCDMDIGIRLDITDDP